MENNYHVPRLSYYAIQCTSLDLKKSILFILTSFCKCFRGGGRVLFIVKPVETNKSTLIFQCLNSDCTGFGFLAYFSARVDTRFKSNVCIDVSGPKEPF